MISIDSVMVYRGLDIGSAKPSPEERSRVPHHLIDVIDPSETMTLGRFWKQALAVEAELRARERPFVACGGTIYYLKHYLYGPPETPPVDPEIRRRVETWAQDAGPEGLHGLLARVDPQSAARIHPNDAYRIKRALEVFEQTGRPLSSFRMTSSPECRFPVLVLDVPRDELARRIERRCDEMFRAGWVDEVRALMSAGWPPDCPGLRTLGYGEIVRDLLRGRDPRQSRDEIVRRTVQLAKRQLTFLRGLREAVWVRPHRDAVWEALQKLARARPRGPRRSGPDSEASDGTVQTRGGDV